jgi:hypothetical protein
MNFKLVVPAGVDFSDLELQRNRESMHLEYKPIPLIRVLDSSGLDTREVLRDEDLTCWVVCEWYLIHRRSGGDVDGTAEEILLEIAQENPHGASQH